MKEKLANFGLLWLRVLAGLGLMYHGWLKLAMGVDLVAEIIPGLGWPFTWNPLLSAWLSTSAEFLGGFFLFLGLGTRLVAVPVAFNMGVAAFVAMAGRPIISGTTPITRELPLAYFTMVVAIFCLGPGRYSVDGSRKGGKRSTPKKSKR